MAKLIYSFLYLSTLSVLLQHSCLIPLDFSFQAANARTLKKRKASAGTTSADGKAARALAKMEAKQEYVDWFNATYQTYAMRSTVYGPKVQPTESQHRAAKNLLKKSYRLGKNPDEETAAADAGDTELEKG